MGLGGISLWQLLIILVIVVLIFGTKKLTSMGADLGGAVKGFRKAMGDADKDEDAAQIDKPDAEFSERSNAEDSSETNQNS
ncbi:MAG: Sec-independent protein translocase subunit TatA [Gammaproteobacteria bacterium]|nr:Sec-independent protein translocase subunit TatA [Gammaproteobacteria bacterium]